MLTASNLVLATSILALVSAAPTLKRNNGKPAYTKYYDLQGHRGARGIANENTLDAFAWGLLNGVTTLEMDNGITKDGHTIVWHDESIDAVKCKDTAPVTKDDPLFPYVGKYIANLTLAQLKTLDCGSKRIQTHTQQVLYPGIKLSTLQEMFDFVECTATPVLFNIESKVDPVFPNYTRGPEVFVEKQLKIFQDYNVVDRVTYQSFDWRTLKLAKKVLPELTLAALFDDTTLYSRIGEPEATSGPSDWLAGLDIDSFQGSSVGAKVVNAAHSIGADIISPAAASSLNAKDVKDPSYAGYIPFTNSSMVDTAHKLGLKVKPWTVNDLNTVDYLDKIGVDGLITDYPNVVRRWANLKDYPLAPLGDYETINKCFKKHAQFHGDVVPDLQ